MFRFRHISKGMLAALVLSVIIAFMISLIPAIEIMQLKGEVSVFKQQKNITLTENNIVDFIASLSVTLPIKKVIWNNNTLSVDFLIDRNQNLDTNDIYKDLYTVSKYSLVQGSNVKEVLLRVFLDDMDKIFVAVSAKKKDIINNPTMKLDSSKSYKDFLNQNFGLNYGNLFK